MRIAVQPCGDSDATQHYVVTIENPVAIERILTLAPDLERSKRDALLRLGVSHIPVWGVTPGKRRQNLTRWKQLKEGDACLLYRDKRIFAQAKIVLTFQSKSLALGLWKTNKAGDTWECIYLLDDLRPIDVDVVEFNAAAGYKANNIIQGFSVLSGAKADAVTALLEIDPDELVETSDRPSAVEVSEALRKIGVDTDIPIAGKARAEAQILRRHLLGGTSTATCDFCGKQLPTTLLVAAHIKKRASCAPDERTNPRVVMRACRLGCDELYEKGFIVVGETGVIKIHDRARGRSKDLDSKLSELEGVACKAFDAETAQFFAWHREHCPQRFR